MLRMLVFRTAAVILLFLIGCSACGRPQEITSWEIQSDLTIPRGFREPLEEIAGLGAESWLAHYQSPSAPAEVRLEDYQIGDLKPVALTCPERADYDQVYVFDYKVLPTSTNSHWIAGDGHYGLEEDWIIEKTQHLGLQTLFWRVQIDLLGPCPCC